MTKPYQRLRGESDRDDVREVLDLLRDAVAAVRDSEWQGAENRATCPDCRGSQRQGHLEGCAFAAVLARAEKAGVE